MTESQQETASRDASERTPVPVSPVEPPPAARASVQVIDDLDPYNLPFTD